MKRPSQLDLQSRMLDPVKEQPYDFLTNLQGLTNFVILEGIAAHIDPTTLTKERDKQENNSCKA